MPAPRKKPNYQLAILALVISNIIWGAAPPIFKLALTNIPPFSLAFLRFFLATILLVPLLNNSSYWKIQKKDFFLLLQNAVYGISANISFFFLGLKLAPSINAGIIATASSIFTTLLAVIFIKERPGTKVLIGSLVGFLGVLIVVLNPVSGHQSRFDPSTILGNIFFVIATLAASAQTITSRQLAQKYKSRTFTFYSFLIGSASFIPLVIYEFFKDPLWPVFLNFNGLLGIAFGAIFSSFLAYTAWGFAAERITAAEIGLYMYLNPIVTVLIAVPLLGEKLTPAFLIGSALAILGIYIAERRIPYLSYHWKSIKKRSIKLK